MAFGFYSLLEAALLVLNAICVLHEERFLSKVIRSVCQTVKTKGNQLNILKRRPERILSYELPHLTDVTFFHSSEHMLISNINIMIFQYGWSANSNQGFGEAPGVKKQVLDIIRSVRTVMRIPLIILNSVVIVKKLLLG